MTTTQQPKKSKKKIVIIILSVFALLTGTIFLFSSSNKAEQSNVQVSGGNENTGNPIESQDGNYIDAVNEKNAKNAEEAMNVGKSHIDVITNKVSSEVDENQFLNHQATANDTEMASMPHGQPMVNNQPQTEVIVHEKVILKEVGVPVEAPYNYKTDASLIALLGLNNQPVEYQVTPVSNIAKREQLAKEKEERLAQAQLQAQNNASNAGGSAGAMAGNLVAVYKVGDLIPATIQTGINSTTQSIVRARIEAGPLAGAILTGSFQQTGTAVQVKFETINIPNVPNSLPFSGVAMNFNTASTALATSVNRHIPEKILMAFTGSFAKGYADALRDNNVTTISNSEIGNNSSSSSTTSIREPKSNKDIMKEAGADGINKAAEIAESFIPAQPTVKVNANMEVGIYMTQDLMVDKSFLK